MDGRQCIVKICEGIPTETNGTLAPYYKDHKDEYMCMSCYNSIVVNGSSRFKEHAIEWQRPPKRRRNDNNLTLSGNITLLTDIIFNREIIEGRPPIFSFSQFRSIMEDADERLGSLFDELEEASCIKNKNEDERKKADRSLAYQCYLMCWNRNEDYFLRFCSEK